MKNKFSKRWWFAAFSFCFLIVSLAVVWLKLVRSPLSLTITHLGYTNRVGPHALLALTNLSHSAITLESTCVVKYTPTEGSLSRRITSIEPNKLRVTQLSPGEGFVQDVFVFPASHGEWQFECHAAYSSRSLELRRSLENWIRKHFSRVRTSLTSWRKFETEWRVCPP